MELIIKPTGRCNFNCTFCSASELDIIHSPTKVHPKIKELIEFLKPSGIILTGGDPLMVEPEYFLDLYDICKCPISATTNMKEFYLNPDKWLPIFKEDHFQLATSFNYGSSRMWDKNTIYTEEFFVKVMNLHKELLGYSVGFIAIIDEYNEHLALDHVYLAKRLGTDVRLNQAVKMGRQGKSYPRYKMMQHYLKIIELGLESYEINTRDRNIGRCFFNTNLMCKSTIRCCYVDNNNNLHYNDCEDEIANGIEKEVETIRPEPKVENPPLNTHLTQACVYCELFRLCNGCASHRAQAIEFPEHCSEMKKLKSRIIEAGWKL